MQKNLQQNFEYRRSVMQALLLLTMLGGVIFSTLNIYRELWSLAAVEFVFGLVAFFYGARLSKPNTCSAG